MTKTGLFETLGFRSLVIVCYLLFGFWNLTTSTNAWRSTKAQAPKTKQAPIFNDRNRFGFGHWDFDHWSLFVICHLGFGIFPATMKCRRGCYLVFQLMTKTGLFGTLGIRSLESENHKTQAPKFKQITSTNIQWQKRGFVLKIGISVIGICLLFGNWNLEFPFMT